MMITVSDCCVRVDGIQYGPQYSSHILAVSEGHKIQQAHYPKASFYVINPENPISPTKLSPKKKKKT